MKNKKGEEILMENVIFFALLAIFFISLFFFISRAGKQVDILEESYAKQIALAIDKAKSGTNITIDMSEIFESAIDNEYNGEIINIDNNENFVLVKLSQGEAKRHYFFSDKNVLWRFDKERAKLILEIV